MQSIVLTVFLSVLASSGFWAFLTKVFEKKSNEKSVERDALLGLLHDRNYSCMKKSLNEGFISVSDYENLTYLYEPYQALGGNGTCEKLKKEVDKLPMINDKD